MRKLLFGSFLLCASFCGCRQPADKPVTNSPDIGIDTARVEDDGFNYTEPMIIDSSDYVMYPLPFKDNKREGSGFYKSSGISYWNIAFYNTLTKKSHLLDETRKMLITAYQNKSFDSSVSDVEGGTTVPVTHHGNFIFYEVIVTDFNRDGKLGLDDPTYLFISDKNGYGFTQISPDNMSVTGWRLFEKTGKVLMDIRPDTNNDKKFDSDDKLVPYVFDLKTFEKAAPVFGKEFDAATGKLFEKLWPAQK